MVEAFEARRRRRYRGSVGAAEQAGTETEGTGESRVSNSTLSTTFDVVIPAFNEADHIESCLEHVVAQDYPAELVTIYVVDAGSTDDTRERVEKWQANDERIHLISGRGRLNAGQAVNAGVEAGESEYIARVDAHTYIEPDYLSASAAVFASVDDDVALIGGQPTQVDETAFGEAVSHARRSPFGVGDSVYADKRTRAFVETVQGGVYRRTALAGVGGFATTMLVSEDEELAYRLTQAGFKVLLDTSLRFRYTTRSTWTALFRQHVNYGRSRVRVLSAHPGSFHLRYAVPLGFVLTLGGLIVLAPVRAWARTALAGLVTLYLGSASAAAFRSATDARRLVPRVVGCFTAQHLGYGIGLLRGIGTSVATGLGLTKPSDAVTRR